MKNQQIQIHRIPTTDMCRIFEDRSMTKPYDIVLYKYHDIQYGTEFSIHLYATIDERPKIGDWYLVEPFEKNSEYIAESVAYLHEDDEEKEGARKIIATTDKKLKYKCDGCKKSENSNNVYTCSCTSLPDFNIDFLKLYASKNGIDVALVDSIEVCPHYNGTHKNNDCSCKTGFVLEPFVNSDSNTITIREEKNNWSKEEIPQLVLDILNNLNDNQENISEDEDLLKYIANYIK